MADEAPNGVRHVINEPLVPQFDHPVIAPRGQHIILHRTNGVNVEAVHYTATRFIPMMLVTAAIIGIVTNMALLVDRTHLLLLQVNHQELA